MYLRTLLLLLTLCFGISSCAAKNPLIGTAEGPGTVVPLSAADDPDGDGENKGDAHFPLTATATGKNYFIFDPNYGAWAVYDATGKRINVGRASGGRLYCPDIGRSCKTIVGTFRIIVKRGAECKSSIYPLKTHGGAPMPYCMLFSAQGYAIHGSNDVPDYNASHGCIRVNPIAAKWLNDELPIGSAVIVMPYQHVEPVPALVAPTEPPPELTSEQAVESMQPKASD